jgi:chromosome partitioning protein
MAGKERRTILVGNIKGGSGKTTIATHLAAACAAAGFATAIADCDRQRSSLAWLMRRPATAPGIAGLDWRREIETPPDAIQRLVIDAPAAMRHRDAKELVALADLVVIPVLPSVIDRDATAYFLRKLGDIKAVRKEKRALALVANRLRAHTLAATALEEFGKKTGLGLAARLRDTQLYPAAAERGLAVFEMPGSRARDYAAEWEPLLALAGLELPVEPGKSAA